MNTINLSVRIDCRNENGPKTVAARAVAMLIRICRSWICETLATRANQ